MKKLLFYLKRVLVGSCIGFTLMTLALFLVGSSVPEFGDAIQVTGILSVYLFSLLLALSNLLLHLPQIKIVWRVLLHYIASFLSFYGVFVLIGMRLTASRSVLTALILFSILYAFFMGIYLFLFYSYIKDNGKKKEKDEKSTYQSIYK